MRLRALSSVSSLIVWQCFKLDSLDELARQKIDLAVTQVVEYKYNEMILIKTQTFYSFILGMCAFMGIASLAGFDISVKELLVVLVLAVVSGVFFIRRKLELLSNHHINDQRIQTLQGYDTLSVKEMFESIVKEKSK